MKYQVHLDIPNSLLSPVEIAKVVELALREQGVALTSVRANDLDTIIWVGEQEKLEGIVQSGPGYGAPRHRAILQRAGYGGG